MNFGADKLRCQVCAKEFKFPSRLEAHAKLHTGEKPYSCQICGKSFATKGNCNAHTRVHTKERPYHCTFCDKCFAQNGQLIVHERQHTGEKPFTCNSCQKSFSSKKVLNIHLRTHTGEKPFACSVCDKRFAAYSNLAIHKRIHTREKPYECKSCGKGFEHSGNLTRHLKTHRTRKKLACNLCNETFFDEVLFLEHNERFHLVKYKKPTTTSVTEEIQSAFEERKSLDNPDETFSMNMPPDSFSNAFKNISLMENDSRDLKESFRHTKAKKKGFLPHREALNTIRKDGRYSYTDNYDSTHQQFYSDSLNASDNYKMTTSADRYHNEMKPRHRRYFSDLINDNMRFNSYSPPQLININSHSNEDECQGTSNSSRIFVDDYLHESGSRKHAERLQRSPLGSTRESLNDEWVNNYNHKDYPSSISYYPEHRDPSTIDDNFTLDEDDFSRPESPSLATSSGRSICESPRLPSPPPLIHIPLEMQDEPCHYFDRIEDNNKMNPLSHFYFGLGRQSESMPFFSSYDNRETLYQREQISEPVPTSIKKNLRRTKSQDDLLTFRTNIEKIVCQIMGEDVMRQLGYPMRTLEQVLVQVLDDAGMNPVIDVRIKEIQRLKLNFKIFLDHYCSN